MQTYPRIDLDQALTWSPAAQALAAQGPDLEKTLADVKAMAQETAAAANNMTELRDMIGSLLGREAAVPANASRTDLETVYTSTACAKSGLPAALNELHRNANLEHAFAETLNSTLDRGEETTKEIRALTEGAEGIVLAETLTAKLDAPLVELYALEHARAVTWAVAKDGKNIREAGDAEARNAIRVLMHLADHLYNNGIGSVYRSKDILKAKAARLYLREHALFLHPEDSSLYS
ncbi:hypothetical protein [Nonomuraea sp. NPDC003214]